MVKYYNKLVRDKIPEIIRNDNYKPVTRNLDGKEFKTELLKKLVEEAKEVEATKGDVKELTKEIGDVYEVIDAIIEVYKMNKEEILNLKEKRKKTRGEFRQRVFLERVEN